ncbi:hypothetical protein SAURM35S_01746 [Streptomyces aurantiogriseus]
MTGIPASLAFCTVSAMVLESTASSRMMSTFSSIIRSIWLTWVSGSASALAYSVLPLFWVREAIFALMMG